MRENKFKPGDRVVRTGPHVYRASPTMDLGDRECSIGWVGTVSRYYGDDNTVRVVWDESGRASAIFDSSLEPYVEPVATPATYAPTLRAQAQAYRDAALALDRAAEALEALQ